MKSNDHTGRDCYIIPKALAYAIATIQHLPESHQEYGDMADMCRLLRKLPPSAAAQTAASVMYHTGLTPDIFADFEDDDEAGLAGWAFYRKYYQSELGKLAELLAEAESINAKLGGNPTAKEI